MSHIDIPRLKRAAGVISLPGSKSISNRTLLLAALAEGETEIHGLLDSDDTRVMLAALANLGVKASVGAGSTPSNTPTRVINGSGGQFSVRSAELFMGNAGTAIRPLTAALALMGGHYELSGVQRMHERPIGDLVDGLRQIGADISYLENEGFPPISIRPARLKLDAPIRIRGDVSSQFLTALLMALPLIKQDAVVELTTELISKPYVEITLNLMARFGVEVERDGWQRFSILAGQSYISPGVIHVEGDASSASYFLAAGAIAGGPVRVEGVGRNSIQGDVRFVEALEKMGGRIEWGENWIEARGPETGRLKAFDLDLNHIPDAAMTLAVAALFADGPCALRNIASWRVKETDRIAAMATELHKLGATVEEGADYLLVTAPHDFNGAPSAGHFRPVGLTVLSAPTGQTLVAIDTYDDHRMAMCFSLAAFGDVPIRINDPECVAKTFPEYFDAFGQIAAPVVAIDGPSASGKGTVAERVAERLGYHYLDSGSLYRLTALAATKAGVALDNEADVAALAITLPARFEGNRIWLADEDVTDAIRTEAMSVGASKVAVLPAVRTALLARQRAYRRFPGLVADGRDMASVVFPDAMAKLFLTASVEIRAERRYKQLMQKGMPAKIRALLEDLQERDARDSARSVAPLKQGDDAECVDTTHISIDEAVSAVLSSIQRQTALTRTI
ncbi:MAG: bifunctional 3-phosphoshikimate 1-carboxyvinyltransferase/cytidylate kinase [Rhodocyclaceae bacterium]|nr:bifunctional 3-phosphoshikimate 1-carboxyvinyltransferase/cytidylate kinase [Rhodocyclaceae bacterium]